MSPSHDSGSREMSRSSRAATHSELAAPVLMDRPPAALCDRKRDIIPWQTERECSPSRSMRSASSGCRGTVGLEVLAAMLRKSGGGI